MIKVGDKKLIGNNENLMSLHILEIKDIYEVANREYYYEVLEYPVLCQNRFILNKLNELKKTKKHKKSN